jgi:hypothetical protein
MRQIRLIRRPADSPISGRRISMQVRAWQLPLPTRSQLARILGRVVFMHIE